MVVYLQGGLWENVCMHGAGGCGGSALAVCDGGVQDQPKMCDVIIECTWLLKANLGANIWT